MNSYRVILSIVLSTCVIIYCIGQPCENKYGKEYNVTLHEGRCCIVRICLAGYKPVKCEEIQPLSTKCVECPHGTFMSQSSKSDEMKICSAHSHCNNEQITIGGGNITHDYICQCNIEKGFINSTSIHQSTSSELKCKNVCPAGQQMVGSDGCTSCQKGYFKPKGESTCMPCLDCSDVGMATILFCNGTHNNTRCNKICLNGTYLNGEDCVPCTNCSALNSETEFACNQTTDSKCSPSQSTNEEKNPSPPASDQNLLWLIVIPILAILAAVIIGLVYIYRRKRAKSTRQCKKEKHEKQDEEQENPHSLDPLLDASDSWKQQIQRNMAALVTRINANDLYGELLKRKIFQDITLYSIFENPNDPSGTNFKLLDALLKTKEDKFDEFCQALTASGKDDIVKEFFKKIEEQPIDDVKDSAVHDKPDNCKEISDDKKECFSKYHDKIMMALRSDELFFAYLTQRGTFTTSHISKLQGIQGKYNRNREIISDFKDGSEKHWKDLCYALVETKQEFIITEYLMPKDEARKKTKVTTDKINDAGMAGSSRN